MSKTSTGISKTNLFSGRKEKQITSLNNTTEGNTGMTEEYNKLPRAYKVKYWADKYNATPNGWVVASLIRQEHISEAASISMSARKKKRKKK